MTVFTPDDLAGIPHWEVQYWSNTYQEWTSVSGHMSRGNAHGYYAETTGEKALSPGHRIVFVC